jgi:putative ABC transport system permease protein
MHGIRLRQALVIFQFVLSSVLITGFLFIHQQIEFIRNKDLGFSQRNVVTVANVIGIGNPEAIAEDFRKIAGVESVGRASGGILGLGNAMNGVADAAEETHISLNFIRADYDFIPTLGIRMVQGRNFSMDFPSDSSAIIINESAVTQLGLKEPVVGQLLKWDDEAGMTHDVRVVGVTNDFHFTSFHEAINPFGFILEHNNGSTFFVKINSDDLSGTLRALGNVWSIHSPDKPFDYAFQDEYTAKLHVTEVRFQRLFSSFTFLAIAIACLGLVGLVTATAESKTKEIGIRKALGSSVIGILHLLTKEFIRLVAVAFLFAAPVAFLIIRAWLAKFAYHVPIQWQLFALAGSLTVLLALAAVCFHSMKAALANPISALRSE